MTSLPGASFGGSGIPNDAVVVSTDLTGVTLGLAAHSRYSPVTLTNDGVNTFFANPGPYDAGHPNWALWNFDYFASGPAGTSYQLSYDFNPAWSPVASDMGTVNFGAVSLNDSQNLGFSWLTLEIPPTFDGPSFGAFNPNVDGRYTFILRATDSLGNSDTATMHVVVGNPPIPEPATMAMFGLGLAGMAAVRTRKNRRG